MASPSVQPAISIPAPPSTQGALGTQRYLIFFIPGNPGPAAYYQSFLSSLHRVLHSRKTAKSTAFEILAVSLSGAGSAIDGSPSLSSMAGETEHAESALLNHVSTMMLGLEKSSSTKVILIGHCAGAYIALELLKRWRGNKSVEEDNHFKVEGTICLFPSVPMKTIGGTVSQAMLSMLSRSALLAHHSMKLLLLLVPSTVIEAILRSTGGLSPDAVKVTNEMIGSRWGIYQALTLWRSQMEDKKSGRWDEAIYQTNCAATSPTYMLFSGNDGEPAVGRDQGRLDPVAGINKSQLPDLFFRNQSESQIVAELVREYVEEIVKQGEKSKAVVSPERLERPILTKIFQPAHAEPAR